jgi:hypothetical protein
MKTIKAWFDKLSATGSVHKQYGYVYKSVSDKKVNYAPRVPDKPE